jgi:molybdate transport system ATP-binding protein
VTLEFDAALTIGPFVYAASFEAREEIVVLFGHSGAGKSVTLQAAAGLLRPSAGRIAVDGKVVFDAAAGVNLPPQERHVGYVVQDLALFPHLTVADNVAFGMSGSHDSRCRRVSELLALLQIDGYAGRMPATLSGGQQQRVALARALGREARLLLLDEPFSALDESLRAGLRRELLRLRAELALTIVFVTHDLREAHLLADRLAVFDGGRVLQFGPREEVFRRPASRRVAELTGVANVFRATVLGREGDWLWVDAGGLRLRCSDGGAWKSGALVDVAIRAERVNLRRISAIEASEENLVPCTVSEEFAYGSTHTIHLRPDGPGPSLEVEIAARPYEVLDVANRRTWTVELPAKDLHVMAAS